MALLTVSSLLLVKFDFVTSKISNHRRVQLHIINKIQLGDLIYPEKSLME